MLLNTLTAYRSPVFYKTKGRKESVTNMPQHLYSPGTPCTLQTELPELEDKQFGILQRSLFLTLQTELTNGRPVTERVIHVAEGNSPGVKRETSRAENETPRISQSQTFTKKKKEMGNYTLQNSYQHYQSNAIHFSETLVTSYDHVCAGTPENKGPVDFLAALRPCR